MKTRIKELRARRELTQDQLARLVGVRRETIGFMENGRYNPSLRLAFAVARALETTVEELFSFDDEVGESS
jgi:putative transcriptional regulator